MEQNQKKSLLLAWFLNIVPGVGLIYVGKNTPGIILIVLATVTVFLMMTGIGAIIGLPVFLLLSLIACVSSVVAASNHNKTLGRMPVN